MEKVGFVGAFDKTDLLVHLAKIMTSLGNKVIVIDTTINQKAKYIIPVINPTTSYVTEFEVDDDYCSKFQVQTVGRSYHQELWVPADELETFNRHIIGTIKVITEFSGDDTDIKEM